MKPIVLGKHLSDTIPIQNGKKQGDSWYPSLSNFALEYAIRMGQESQMGLKLNATHQPLFNADDSDTLWDKLKHHKEKHRSSILLVSRFF
jgi:hypothetical protein